MDRIRWDPISSLYSELFPKLLKSYLITPIHLPPLEPPFPRWYDSNAHCDFHCGNPKHSIENCTLFKNRVQDFIQAGLLKSKTSNEQRNDGSQFSSFSKGRTSVMKQATRTMDEMPTIARGRTQWDPIPITYTKLLPKLIDGGHIMPIHQIPFRPPFPKWYNINVRCDYHAGISGHLTEDCNAFKYKVRDLTKEGKLNFEGSNKSAEVKDLFRTEADMTRQEREAPREASFEKAKILGDNVPIVKIKKMKQFAHRPLKGQKNDYASQTRGKKKKCSKIWSRV